MKSNLDKAVEDSRKLLGNPLSTRSEHSQSSAPSHTPGPWTFYGDTHVAHKGELIAEVLRGGNRQLPIQSNRALIAAAPLLLEACKAALARLTSLEDYDHETIGWSPAKTKCEAAINAAQGNSGSGDLK